MGETEKSVNQDDIKDFRENFLKEINEVNHEVSLMMQFNVFRQFQVSPKTVKSRLLMSLEKTGGYVNLYPILSNEYYVNDVEKIKSNDHYCQRFINHKKKVDEAVKMAQSALKWRKSFEVESITEKSFSKEIWDMASLYAYGKDKGGHLVLIFHVKKHQKNADQAALFKKFVIYWFEKLGKETNGQPISVIFDCVGSGLSNMDMDLMRFIVDSFLHNYPSFLYNILVIDIPWVLNAAWKIIKLWLPASSIEKIKFLNQKTILQFIDASQLLECMGGEDKYEYKYIPSEEKCEA
ncbi:Motile sperm domain-containing protein 2 [Nymphon striatum]|nr:Motile sperm domain-containing protein 2 [Nymphon striatum]